MVRTSGGDRLSRKCEMCVLHGDLEKSRPGESVGSHERYLGEVRMPEGRRFEDSSEPRRIQSVAGQEGSESGSNDYEDWIEIVEEIRIG